MDTDIDLGRIAVHGAIIGVATVAREAIDADDGLSPAERALRHALADALQAISHSVTEVVAEAIENHRRES
jgi:hypothetical protein